MSLTTLDNAEVDETYDVCQNCKFAFGILFLGCGNSQSEFFEDIISPFGWCPEFQPQPNKE